MGAHRSADAASPGQGAPARVHRERPSRGPRARHPGRPAARPRARRSRARTVPARPPARTARSRPAGRPGDAAGIAAGVDHQPRPQGLGAALRVAATHAGHRAAFAQRALHAAAKAQRRAGGDGAFGQVLVELAHAQHAGERMFVVEGDLVARAGQADAVDRVVQRRRDVQFAQRRDPAAAAGAHRHADRVGTFQHQRGQAGARGHLGGGQPGRARADDDDLSVQRAPRRGDGPWPTASPRTRGTARAGSR